VAGNTGFKVKVIVALFGLFTNKWTNAVKFLPTAFARAANGSIDVFHNAMGVRLSSLWAKTEYPILIENNVNIVYHIIFP
jgi:hypothetical protein